MLKIGKWLTVISLAFLLVGATSYFYSQDEMLEIIDPETTNLVKLSPNTSQSIELEKMGLYVALRLNGENTLPEIKLMNSSGKEIVGRDAAWYDFDRAGADGSIYQTVMIFENPKDEEYILYNEGETTLWLIDETSNQVEIMSNPGFIGTICGFCMGIPLVILGLITLIIGWRKKANIQNVSTSDGLYINKEGGKIKIVTNIQNIPEPFKKNNDLDEDEIKNIEEKDAIWKDWDNQE